MHSLGPLSRLGARQNGGVAVRVSGVRERAASDVLVEPSVVHLSVDSHSSNFRMGGRFGPRLFTGKTEHNRDHVVAKRDDGPGMFPAGAGNIDLPMHEHVSVVGWAGSHSAHLGDL